MTAPAVGRGVNLASVFLGGCAGTLLRASVAMVFPSAADAWPWATLVVNLAGCYLLGHLLRWAATGHLGGGRQLFLATGVAGALTTFSSFAVEVVSLATEVDPASAMVYAGTSVVLGVALCSHGMWAGDAAGRNARHRDAEPRP